MDIDIDLKPDFKPERVFKNIVPASMVENGELKKHLVGVYLQAIPKDPFTKLAAIPYKEADDFGFKKVDMLHLSLLEPFESKDEVKYFMHKRPNWALLDDREFVEKLFHLAKQFDIVYRIKPKSVMAIADVLALIRPGKLILVDKYIRNPEACRAELYTKRNPSDLRKAHAVAYAHNVVIHMNLLEAGLI
jgi:hypothetical protein